jgi:hypothetical protein
MIAQEHAPSYQQQHNPTGSQALHLALLLCFRHGLLLSPEKGRERGKAGAAGAAACVAGDGWRGRSGCVGTLGEAGLLTQWITTRDEL